MSDGSEEQLLLACRRHPLAAELSRGLDRARVEQGARVLVAASGGADSTALLALCAGLAARGRVAPWAGHVDHALRTDSAMDAECVRRTGALLGVQVLARTLSLANGAGIPKRARAARYEAIAAMAAECGAQVVLAAHHADDQLETVLLSLARGAGLGGVGGMPTRRPLPCESAAAAGISLVRPLLRVSRAALRAACVELGLEWREDPGNERRDIPRGIMRHVVIPAMESIAPGAVRRAARTAELARLGNVLLESHVQAMRAPDGSIDRAALASAPEALAATAVWLMAGERLDDAARWSAAEAIVDGVTDPRRFPLQGGGELVVDAHRVRVAGGAVAHGMDSDPLRQRS
jgi:tRNA(Ile)-lysidine synthase